MKPPSAFSPGQIWEHEGNTLLVTQINFGFAYAFVDINKGMIYSILAVDIQGRLKMGFDFIADKLETFKK